MRTLVKLLSQGVEAPLMVDTTEVEVAVQALRQIPGRAILNSVHLERGRDKLDQLLPHVVEHGAAVVALTIDESGMAKTAERKSRGGQANRRDLRGRVSTCHPSDLIFDALTFTLATGEDEYRRSAMETLEGIRRVKERDSRHSDVAGRIQRLFRSPAPGQGDRQLRLPPPLRWRPDWTWPS